MGKQINFYSDLCLCGSGKVLENCCLTLRVETKPRGPKTGLSNPKCYARALADCCATISREHFISESVLELWNANGLSTVIGIPTINHGAPTELYIQNLRPKVLCERHNNCLSGLDSLALKFFTFLLERTPQSEFLLINGYEIERWFLKMLCGMGAAGFVANDSGVQLTDWNPPGDWLEILYGELSLPNDCGLSFVTNTVGTAPTGRIWIQTMFAPEPRKEFAGLAFVCDQFPFVFTMQRFPESDQSRHRPSVFQIQKDDVIREVHFGWRNDKLVGIRIKPTPVEPRDSHPQDFNLGEPGCH